MRRSGVRFISPAPDKQKKPCYLNDSGVFLFPGYVRADVSDFRESSPSTRRKKAPRRGLRAQCQASAAAATASAFPRFLALEVIRHQSLRAGQAQAQRQVGAIHRGQQPRTRAVRRRQAMHQHGRIARPSSPSAAASAARRPATGQHKRPLMRRGRRPSGQLSAQAQPRKVCGRRFK